MSFVVDGLSILVFGSSAGEASTSLVGTVGVLGPCTDLMLEPRVHSDGSEATSILDSSDAASISDHGPLAETAARGSDDSPCRAYYPLTHPRDGHEPHDGALSSGEFPPKLAAAEMWMTWGLSCVFAPRIH